MNWGSRIVLAFIIFAGIMGTMVVISMNQEVNLVSDNYYVQEIAFEEQIERLKNTNALEEQPTISFNKETLAIEVWFPASLQKEFKNGEIHLFRPSDNRLDLRQPIALKNGRMEVSMAKELPGLWRVKLNWQDISTEFYLEKQIVL